MRTGKSTFVKRFMETLVLPNMESSYRKDRATDELPQSSGGRTIMTTEPKFVPEEAVKVKLENGGSMSVRLIDCVGYIVPSSIGYIEDEQPRMVLTPWFEQEVPFNMAAEVGTKKVITEHSTIGIVVTTDGSISDIPREEYQEAEERVIEELSELGKPFVVLLNSRNPQNPDTIKMAEMLEERYGVPVLPVNCQTLSEEEIRKVISSVLSQFPMQQIAVEIPRWLVSLPADHWLKSSVYKSIKDGLFTLHRARDLSDHLGMLRDCQHINDARVLSMHYGSGSARVSIELPPEMFYKIVGETTGFEINNEADLMNQMIQLALAKKNFDKFKSAIDQVEATGYGIVMPSLEELSLEEPEIVKQGGRYGVKLKASAPSIHMMRADINTEVAPIVGSEKQSQELVYYLLKEFEESPAKIWQSNIFGKSLHELVNEGLHNKLYRMPTDARHKIQQTIERVINDGCSGLICIII